MKKSLKKIPENLKSDLNLKTYIPELQTGFGTPLFQNSAHCDKFEES